MLLAVHTNEGTDIAVRFHRWQFAIDAPSSLHGQERLDTVRAAFEGWYRKRAAVKLRPRVERFASHLGVRPEAVLIRDQRRRWAS